MYKHGSSYSYNLNVIQLRVKLDAFKRTIECALGATYEDWGQKDLINSQVDKRT